MHLAACPIPVDLAAGSLEPAPFSSLLEPGDASDGARWDAFWGADDRYYARLTRADGAECWFRIDETPAARTPTPPSLAAVPARDSARVLFRVRMAARGRGLTSLAVRAGRSRRPQP